MNSTGRSINSNYTKYARSKLK